METTTDTNGSYVFQSVPVVNVTGTDDNAAVGRPLTVGANPPPDRNLLVGVSFVVPQAQINDSTDDNIGTDGGSDNDSLNDSNGDGQTTTFIDGQIYEAPIIVLARLNTTVSGVLRNERTGAVIANQQVVLDYQGPDNSELTICAVTGVCSLANAAPTFNLVATTGADGSFSIMNAPDNSCLALFVPRHDNISFERNDPDGPSGIGGCADTLRFNDVQSNIFDLEDLENLVSTRDDGGFEVFLANVFATPIIASGDNTPPVVANFGGILTTFGPGSGFVDVALPATTGPGTGKATALIREDIDGTAGTPLVVTFSEPVQGIVDGDSVLVRSAPDGEVAAGVYLDIASATLSADGRTLTIVLSDATPLPSGDEFVVYLAQNAFFDFGGNGLVFDNEQGTLEDNLTVIPRPYTGATSLMNTAWVDYIVLCLKRIGQANTDVDQVVANQVTIDPGTDNDTPLEQAVSLQFSDVFDIVGSTLLSIGDSVITQLNDATDGSRTPGLPGSSAEDRESALVQALIGTGQVLDDVARVEFTPVPASNGYRIVVTRNAPGVAGTTTRTVPNGDFSPTGTQVVGPPGNLLVESNANGDFAIIVSDVRSGDTVSVTTLDDIGNPSNDPPSVVTLVDNVIISPVLQRSFQTLYDDNYLAAARDGLCSNRDLPVLVNPSSSGGNAGVILDATGAIGEGGEGAGGANTQTIGNVCLGISPELLIAFQENGVGAPPGTDPEDSVVGVVTPDMPYFNAFNSLLAGNPDQIGDDSDGLMDPEVISNRWESRPAYDADAFAAWGPQPRRVQIATSEDASLVGTPGFGGTSGISAFQENNNTVFGQLESPVILDGVSFLSADPLNLANLDHGTDIVLSGAIADANGNVGDSDVTVKDQWAPMVVSAERQVSGDLVIMFNEDIVVPPGTTLFFLNGGQTATATLIVGPGNVSASNTITIPASDLAPLATVFDGSGTYSDGGVDRDHFYVDTSLVQDTRGNRFEDTSFDDSLAEDNNVGGAQDDPGIPTGEGELDTYPVFVGVDLIGPFAVAVTTTGFEPGSGSFTVSYTATHPIYLSAAAAAAGGCAVNGNMIAVPGFLADGALDQADFVFGGFTPATFTPMNNTTTNISFMVTLTGTLSLNDSVDSMNTATSQLICPTPMSGDDTINPPQQVAN